jgi:hypothetical protein
MSEYKPRGELLQLSDATTAARALLANMADIIGEDEDVIASTVEGETNLHEALAGALKRFVELGAMASALKKTIDQIGSRGARLEQSAALIRTAMLHAMEAGQINKFEHPLGTLSIRPVAPKVEITNEADVPPDYWKLQPPKLDKKAVLDALKAKTEVPGAQLSNGGITIAIKLS